MKLDESILEQFDLDPSEDREPVSVMRVSEMLDILKENADRIIRKSTQYFNSNDIDLQVDCIDIVSIRLNDFVQVFIDLLIFLRIKEGTYNGHSDSLRYCISSYDSFFEDQTPEERKFLENLLLRNEITHDYFNRELHQQKLITMMQNDISGAREAYQRLYDYCSAHALLSEFINKNR